MRKRKPQPESSGPTFAVIPKGAKPSKAASSDKTRPTLTNGFLRCKDDRWELLVTDSYVMARLPVEIVQNGHEPTGGTIPLAALKHAEKEGGVRLSEDHVEPCDRFGGETGVLYRRVDVESPDFDKLLEGKKRQQPFRVALNSRLLRNLAEALGTDTVYLTFDAKNNLLPIAVEAPSGDRDGVLMPARMC